MLLLLSFANEKKNEANNKMNKLFKLPLELFNFFFKLKGSVHDVSVTLHVRKWKTLWKNLN